MRRTLTVSLVLLVMTTSGLVTFTEQPVQAQPDSAQTEDVLSPSKFGIGLQATGSACCISMRQWSSSGRGLELTFMADRLLMVGLRGMSKFAEADLLDPYTGAGINVVFGPRLSQGIPLTSLQFLLGLEVGLPFLPPQLAINFEAALEFELDREFFTYIGGGLHFYF